MSEKSMLGSSNKGFSIEFEKSIRKIKKWYTPWGINIQNIKKLYVSYDCYKIKKIYMKIDNKTILIVGLVILAAMGILFKEKDLSLALGSGLVGYLSKDVTQKK